MVAKKRKFEDLFEKEIKENLMDELLDQSKIEAQDLENKVIQGKVISVNKDIVTLDVASKSEAFISTQEFYDLNNSINIKVGDIIDIYQTCNLTNGKTYYSRKKVLEYNAKNELEQAFSNKTNIEVYVDNSTRGGLKVSKQGFNGFMPASLIELKLSIDKLEKYIGKILTVKIIDFNSKANSFVCSRKAYLEEDLENKKVQLLPKIFEGAKFKGKIVNILDYGVFVDIGGLDGFIHISDLSYKRLNSANELFRVGDSIEVIVLKYNKVNNKLYLGHKQLSEDPYISICSKLSVGDRVKGRVTNLTDFGAFLEIVPGVEGMIHVSEMSWVEKVKKPSDIINIGDLVEAQILAINNENKRISLGLKQVLPNPLEEFLKEKPIGTRMTGIVKSVTDFGLFVDIGQSVDGLVRVQDLAWNIKDRSLNHYSKDDEIAVVLIDVDLNKQKISLGIKQLSEDPWSDLNERYEVGKIVEGKVVKITEFGLFLEIEPGIDGLVHLKELQIDKSKKIQDKFREEEILRAIITNIDLKNKKISLSIKELAKKEEQDNLSNYKNSNNVKVSTNLGDLIKEKYS